MNVAELLLPAIRWQEASGFSGQRALIDLALELGVGGFILFGGPTDDVRALTGELRRRARTPLLIGADLERGAGQQFRGATGLPPLAAIGSLDDAEAAGRAASLTAREARALGVNWIYAPVADVDLEPDNPIIGTRAFGDDPQTVARLATAWIEACQREHVLACAKHFPGHGRTTTDSHAELPVVAADRPTLDRTDLVPFRAAVAADVASVMTAHVAYPALDSRRAPATLSAPILRDLLRGELGFDGLIVTDALIMAGVRQDDREAGAAVRALRAGCDLLLYPEDVEVMVREITAAFGAGALDRADVERSIQRRRRYADWAAGTESAREPEIADQEWASSLACRVIHVVQGDPPRVNDTVALTVIDDDLGGPFPAPSREPLTEELRARGVAVFESLADTPAKTVHAIALFGDIRAWKGRPGYSASALSRVREAAGLMQQRTVILQFGHPRLAPTIGVDVPIVSAWGGEATMQRAAARWITRGC